MNSEFHLAARHLTPEEVHELFLQLAHVRQIVLGFIV